MLLKAPFYIAQKRLSMISYTGDSNSAIGWRTFKEEYQGVTGGGERGNRKGCETSKAKRDFR